MAQGELVVPEDVLEGKARPTADSDKWVDRAIRCEFALVEAGELYCGLYHGMAVWPRCTSCMQDTESPPPAAVIEVRVPPTPTIDNCKKIGRQLVFEHRVGECRSCLVSQQCLVDTIFRCAESAHERAKKQKP